MVDGCWLGGPERCVLEERSLMFGDVRVDDVVAMDTGCAMRMRVDYERRDPYGVLGPLKEV